MKKILLFFAIAAVLMFSLPVRADDGLQEPDPDGSWEESTLKFKLLPSTNVAVAEAIQVAMKLDLPSPSGGFAVLADNSTVSVDTTGDGNINTKAKEGRPVFLSITYDDGEKGRYAVRFYRGPRRAWCVETATSMSGKVGKESFSLIDANCNGKFDEIGTDAVLVGRSKWAQPLGRVMSIKGKLYHVRVDSKGTTVGIQEYSGPTGTLDLNKNFRAPGALQFAIVQSGEVYFDLSARGGQPVPVGKFVFVRGRLEKSRKSCNIVRGKMPEIEVGADAKVEPEWGPPIRIDFKPTLNDGKLHIDARLQFFGRAEEEYTDFADVIMTPKISVRSKEGAEAASGTFATG